MTLGEEQLVTMQLEARRVWRDSFVGSSRIERDREGLTTRDADFIEPSKVYNFTEATVGLALQHQYLPTEWFSLTSGLRADLHTVWGGLAAPAVTAKLKGPWGLWCSAASGVGYKMPSFDSRTRSPIPQLNLDDTKFVAGNPDLLPEKSWGQEARVGWRQLELSSWFGLELGVTGFRNDFWDKLHKEVIEGWDGALLPLERDINIGRAMTQGVELEIAVRLFDALTLRTNQTLMRAENLGDGGRLNLIPQKTTNIIGVLDLEVIDAQLSGHFQFQDRADRTETTQQPPLATVNARYKQRLGDHLSLFLELNNATNAFWDKDGDGDSDIPPLNLFFGITGTL
jgi:outer membrane receptor for ferrienterochelin and colicin